MFDMLPVLTAFTRATRDIGQPRIIAVLFLPMLGALVLWSVLAWFFWDKWTAGVRAMVESMAASRWLAEHGAAWVVASMGAIGVLALLVPAMLITAMIVMELVAMPVIVSVVGRAYPSLEKAKGGSAVGSMLNASIALGVFGLLWIVTLPLWLTGIGALVLPALNAAYLNQRLFRYDALAEHANPQEYRAIVTQSKSSLYALGLLLALLYYVPFVNLVAPVVSGLAFTHYCLAELAKLRMAR
jgi:CysZ protein